MIAARHSEIPFGQYCYGYVPADDSGFKNMEDLYHYASTLPDGEWMKLRSRMQRVKYCPHWLFLEGGRVECTHLGIRATLIGQQKEARDYYLKHPEERYETPTDFLLGDAIKACNLNTDGTDFTIPH